MAQQSPDTYTPTAARRYRHLANKIGAKIIGTDVLGHKKYMPEN